jgi:hypothetical protein
MVYKCRENSRIVNIEKRKIKGKIDNWREE